MSAMGRAYTDCQIALGYDDMSDQVVWDDISLFFEWLCEHGHRFDTDVPADAAEKFRREHAAPVDRILTRFRAACRRATDRRRVIRLWNWVDHQENPEVLWDILKDECPWAFVS